MKTAVTFRDPAKVMTLAGFEFGKRDADNVYVVCPYHPNDEVASCSASLAKQVFHCQGCGQDGTLAQLVAKKMVGEDSPAAILGIQRIYKEYLQAIAAKVVHPGKVETWHRRLMADDDLIAALNELKGVGTKTLEEFSVGWDGERYTIPVRDSEGEIVNVRRRTLDKADKQKCLNLRGYGSPVRLYPLSSMASQRIIIVEGELKALLMCQMGFPAVTGTAGVNNWNHEWDALFAGKDVVILFDVDEPGKSGSVDVARGLLKVAASVKIATLPLDVAKHPKGDVTDWVVSESATTSDVASLLLEAPPFNLGSQAPSRTRLETAVLRLDTLEEATIPAKHHRPVEVDGLVEAEDPDIHRVPISWSVRCAEDQEMCKTCPVNYAGQHDFAFDPWHHVDLLRLHSMPDYLMINEMRRIHGIPQDCHANVLSPAEYANIRMVELVPDAVARRDDRPIAIPTFFVDRGDGRGADVEQTADIQTVTGYPTMYPKSGLVVLLSYAARTSGRALDEFRMTPETDLLLRPFQPAEWTADAVAAKMRAIAEDLGAHVTHIHGRPDMHIVFDLAFHSVLELPFDRENSGGWLDVAVLGDGGQGKSNAVSAMRQYYKAGDIAVGGSASLPGLLGAAVQSVVKKRWIYRKGKLPLNDRRLLVIEEAGNLPTDVVRALREPRSSGVHVMAKATERKAAARTRIIWVGNSRSGLSIADFAQGILIIPDVFPEEADMRRLDLVLIVGRDEVDISTVLNGKGDTVHSHTSDMCSTLVTWAWSRAKDDVKYEREALDAMRHHAGTLSKKFSPRIPLLLDTETFHKLARLSAACAARTYSSEDGETLLVRKCHVDFMAAFIDRLYSAKICDFSGYSKRAAVAAFDDAGGEVESTLRNALRARSLIEVLLDSPLISSRLVGNICGVDMARAESMVGILVRNRALRVAQTAANSYARTTGFVSLLRRLAEDATIADQTPEEKYRGEEY